MVALVTVLAGCGGGQSSSPTVAADTATQGVTDTATSGKATPTPTSTATESGPPFVDGGSLNASALARAHFAALLQSGSFTARLNRSVTYARNGSAVGRAAIVSRVDLLNQRERLTKRFFGPNGSLVLEEARFTNESVTCSVGEDGARCRDGNFTRRRLLGLSFESTPPPALGSPAFSANGTVTRNNATLYRYTATSLRSAVPEGFGTLRGTDPALVEATLLVATTGRIVEYRLTYEAGVDGTRQRWTLVYRTGGIGGTTVEVPPEVG